MRVPELRVSLLGAPSIQAGRTRIATDTRKATALLAYLAVTEQPQRRSTVAALLWPDTDEQKARGALRRTLSVLRTALRDRWLVAEGETVELERQSVRVDVVDFRRAIREGQFGAATALYRGDFLQGFSLRDSREFDDWQATQSESLRAEYADALSRLAAQSEHAGDLAAAIGHAKRRLALDPLHEPAHRDLMRLYARSGDRGAALRQYREAARLLDSELGVTPVAETRGLKLAIEGGTLPAANEEASVTTSEAIADLHTLHGDYRRAIESYEAAAANAAASARAGIEHKLAQVHHRRGDWTKAERHYAAAHKASEGAAKARILADWSLASHRSGDGARAKRLANEALGLAERSKDKGALAQTHNILGVLGGNGARAHLETSVALASELGDRGVHAAALNNLALALKEAGDLDRARKLTEQALAECAASGDRHRTAALHNNLADILRAQGRKDESMRQLKRAVRLFSEIGEAGTHEPEVWKLVAW